jgi:hypothetical protein
MAKLLAALSAGQGGSGNPVHVIIKERESKGIVLVLLLPQSQAKVHGFQALRASWSLPAYPLSVSFFTMRAAGKFILTICSYPHHTFRRGRELRACQGRSSSIRI